MGGYGIPTCVVCFTHTTPAHAWLAGEVRPLKKPPSWLKRPVSVSFGFGGRLASMTNHKQQIQDPMTGQVRSAAAVH